MQKVTPDKQKNGLIGQKMPRKHPLFDSDEGCAPDSLSGYLSPLKPHFDPIYDEGNPQRLRDNTCRVIAHIHGVTPSYVRKIRNGDRKNDAIMDTLIEYEQEHSLLIEKLKEIVPLRSASK